MLAPAGPRGMPQTTRSLRSRARISWRLLARRGRDRHVILGQDPIDLRPQLRQLVLEHGLARLIVVAYAEPDRELHPRRGRDDRCDDEVMLVREVAGERAPHDRDV